MLTFYPAFRSNAIKTALVDVVKGSPQVTMYKCPQCGHTSNEAGNCPTCNVPMTEEAGGASEEGNTAESSEQGSTEQSA